MFNENRIKALESHIEKLESRIGNLQHYNNQRVDEIKGIKKVIQENNSTVNRSLEMLERFCTALLSYLKIDVKKVREVEGTGVYEKIVTNYKFSKKSK